MSQKENNEKTLRYSLVLTKDEHHRLKKRAYAELMTISQYVKKELCN